GIKSIEAQYPGLEDFMIHWDEGLGPKEFKEQLRWLAKDVMPAFTRELSKRIDHRPLAGGEHLDQPVHVEMDGALDRIDLHHAAAAAKPQTLPHPAEIHASQRGVRHPHQQAGQDAECLDPGAQVTRPCPPRM